MLEHILKKLDNIYVLHTYMVDFCILEPKSWLI